MACQNQYIFIQENAFENVDCKMTSISSQLQWVKTNTAFSYSSAYGCFLTTENNGYDPYIRFDDDINTKYKYSHNHQRGN